MDGGAKTVRLHLYDGTMEGVVGIESTSWEQGKLLCVPRAKMGAAMLDDLTTMSGVFVLLCGDRVRVGNSRDLSQALAQCRADGTAWERVVLITTMGGSLGDADIAYLASNLASIGAWIQTNIPTGKFHAIAAARMAYLRRCLEESLFLMGVVGIDVATAPEPLPGNGGIRPLPGRSVGKGEALAYVRKHGIDLKSGLTSFATLQKDGSRFWINPKVDLLRTDWHLVLNDNSRREFVVLHVPANTMCLQKDGPRGLLTRSDKPQLIDLQINPENLKDTRSGMSFAPYVITRIPY